MPSVPLIRPLDRLPERRLRQTQFARGFTRIKVDELARHPQLIAAERRSRLWVYRSDALMIVLLLGATGAALARDQFWFAALFAAVAASGTVASLLIEPATVEATFGKGDA